MTLVTEVDAAVRGLFSVIADAVLPEPDLISSERVPTDRRRAVHVLSEVPAHVAIPLSAHQL